ncbi:MAG: TetR/AcrR family transcriptional regulator [Thermomicrobiales bacterium]
MAKGKKLTTAERRRAEQREDVRQDILEAARELVVTQGAKALTMRAVAKAVGYSPGAIYEYYGSKDEILEAMYFHGTQGLDGRTRQVLDAAGPHASPIDRVGMAGRAYRSFALDHPDLYLLIFSVPDSGRERSAHEEAVAEEESFGALVDMLRDAIARGQIAAGDPEHIAAALWSYVHGFVMLEITGRLPADSPGLTDHLFEKGLEIIALGLNPRHDTETRKHVS